MVMESDVQREEEEEEKAKQVSKEGNASSSTPLEVSATESEGSIKGNVHPPFNKQTIHNVDDLLSKSKFGGVVPCLSERALTNRRNEYPIPNIATVVEFHRSVHCLFHMGLTQSDIECGRLSIPFQTAELHFPTTNGVSNYENQIVICDTRHDNWYMTLTYNARESSAFKFAITSGWQGFVDCYGLKAMDVIRFYKPFKRLHSRHFLIDYVKAEENAVLPSQNSCMKQGCDEARDDAILESNFGASCSSERTNEKVQDPESESHRRIFLFELQLMLNDVEQGMLFIPEQRAAKHFPPLLTHIPYYNYEHQIEVSDTQNQNWKMTLVYNSLLRAFIIVRGWHRFVVSHGLEFMDVICFYKTLSRLHDKHFIIEHVKRGEAETDNNPPEFKPENFLFELQLTSGYVSDNWLKLPKEEVRNHFPEIEIPPGIRLNFTDARNEHWTMTIFFVEGHDAYIILDGWEGFVNKHRLEAMDVIRFYKPVQPLHERHFLIQCVKRGEAAVVAEAEAGTTNHDGELGGAKKDGNGGNRANKGGRNHGGSGGGGGGGQSRGDGSPRKGKITCCWTWKNKLGDWERAVMGLEEFLHATDSVWDCDFEYHIAEVQSE
ncbi:unnamed protein product [Camellia sinensis]